MRKIVGVLLVAGFAFFLISVFAGLSFGPDERTANSVGAAVVRHAVAQTGAVNTVTSVVVLYRGFDTLGEVTVLFLAALGMSLLLTGERWIHPETEDESFILRTGSHLLFPFMVLFGLYVVAHGHLSPGGGFPGGVIIATGFFVVLMTSKAVRLHEGLMSFLEGLAGLTFVGLGIVGLVGPQRSFLANFLGHGTPGLIVSAGIIPFIYAAVGIKVASELSSAVGSMLLSPYGKRKED